MTMSVNSINPFLAGTGATLAENVITLLHGRCSWGIFFFFGEETCFVIKSHVCVRSKQANNSDVCVVSGANKKRLFFDPLLKLSGNRC